jgi:hypothetical protein
MPLELKDIPDGCGLLRRVTPNQIVHDGNIGRRRLSSGAFRDRQMSVDAECLLAQAGLDRTFSLQSYPQLFLVRIRAGDARQLQQAVEHRPLEHNVFHAEVVGPKSGAICNVSRRIAEWVRKPDDV